jgi:hypothetical protein
MSEMKKTSAVIVGLLLFSIFAAIIQPVVGVGEDFGKLEDLQRHVEIYNQHVDEIPFVKSFIGEERINCNIALNNGSVLVLGITTARGAKVRDLKLGAISNPTMNAYTTENTVRSIMGSEDPVSSFQDAFNSGAIRVEGVGLGNTIKVGFMSAAMKMYSFVKDLRG